MKNYYRILLGRQNAYAEDAYNGNYIGGGFIHRDLTDYISKERTEFNKELTPYFLEENPRRTKISIGLACGMIWTIAKDIKIGDIVLCPNGKGEYYVGEITGDYQYHKDEQLPHRRPVRWFPNKISRSEMSEQLRNSTGSIGTVSNISQYAEEIEKFISGTIPLDILTQEASSLESLSAFVLEKHLEDFLVQNWKNTDLGKNYDIYEEDGEMVGQQYLSDTGPIDILAISKDKRELLVVELKRGRASDTVVGQIQRYMGYVKAELAESNQKVSGVIIAFEDGLNIHRALSVTQNIDLYTYTIDFKLKKRL